MKYDIWSEGYLASGMEGIPEKAKLVASNVEGDTFIDACYNWAKANKNELQKWGGMTINLNTDICSARLWCCRLFPTEVEARETFG